MRYRCLWSVFEKKEPVKQKPSQTFGESLLFKKEAIRRAKEKEELRRRSEVVHEGKWFPVYRALCCKRVIKNYHEHDFPKQKLTVCEECGCICDAGIKLERGAQKEWYRDSFCGLRVSIEIVRTEYQWPSDQESK